MSKISIKPLRDKDNVVYPLTALEAVRLPDDFSVIGTTVGNLENGDVIPAGKSMLDILNLMLKKTILPEPHNPTMTMSLKINGNEKTSGDVEVGTHFSGECEITDSYRDGNFSLPDSARTAAGCSITRFTVLLILDGSGTEYTKTGESITTEYVFDLSTIAKEGNDTLAIMTIIEYGNNTVIPKDNMGNECPDITISSGELTKTINWNGKFRCYVGYDNGSTIPTTDTEIRRFTKTSNILMPYSNNATASWTMKIESDDCKRIVIAYPSNIKDISQIEFTTEPGSHYEENFTREIISNCGGVDGSNMHREYKVYTWLLGAPIKKDSIFKITCN